MAFQQRCKAPECAECLRGSTLIEANNFISIEQTTSSETQVNLSDTDLHLPIEEAIQETYSTFQNTSKVEVIILEQ